MMRWFKITCLGGSRSRDELDQDHVMSGSRSRGEVDQDHVMRWIKITHC